MSWLSHRIQMNSALMNERVTDWRLFVASHDHLLSQRSARQLIVPRAPDEHWSIKGWSRDANARGSMLLLLQKWCVVTTATGVFVFAHLKNLVHFFSPLSLSLSFHQHVVRRRRSSHASALHSKIHLPAELFISRSRFLARSPPPPQTMVCATS